MAGDFRWKVYLPFFVGMLLGAVTVDRWAWVDVGFWAFYLVTVRMPVWDALND